MRPGRAKNDASRPGSKGGRNQCGKPRAPGARQFDDANLVRVTAPPRGGGQSPEYSSQRYAGHLFAKLTPRPNTDESQPASPRPRERNHKDGVDSPFGRQKSFA